MGLKGNQCSDCKKVKPRSEFYKNKTRASGLSYICRICQRKRTEKWVKVNPEKVKQAKARYRARHPVKLSAHNLSMYWSNIDYFRKQNREANRKRKANGNDRQRWYGILIVRFNQRAMVKAV